MIHFPNLRAPPASSARSWFFTESRSEMSGERVAHVSSQNISFSTPLPRSIRRDIELHRRAIGTCHAHLQPVTPSANPCIVACEGAPICRPPHLHCIPLSDYVRDCHTELADRVRLRWRHGHAIRDADAGVTRQLKRNEYQEKKSHAAA